ncbi:ANTAR domain-containing protein [Cellulomonas sp. NTE-D12]|uniref:ANTAR domain-containing protein n=1 Tax=Cellulomonas sp. NTE-D12 TaxID=2962632 RepID=UPI003081F04E|nr:hypothetical protein CELD12_07300 [Cellulomonas sp. NTE-D12]
MPPLADADDSRCQPLAALSAALHERAAVEPALQAWAAAVPAFLRVRVEVRLRLTCRDGRVVQVSSGGDERRSAGERGGDGSTVGTELAPHPGWLVDEALGGAAALAPPGYPAGAVLGGPVVGGGALLVMLLGTSPVDWDHGLGTVARAAVDDLRAVLGLAVGLEEAVLSAQDADAVLRSRAVIDQAVGVVMAHHGCGADQAMERLRRASQRSGVPLARLAARLLTDVSGSPPAEPGGFEMRRAASA